MATQNGVANGEMTDTLIVGQTSQGVELHGTLLRVSRYDVVFEVYNPNMVLHLSEVLTNFKIVFNNRMVYSGRAVISNVVNTGMVVVCEAKLNETGFSTASFSPFETAEGHEGFPGFLRQWQKLYKVMPEFKVVIADMQSFLADLRLWLEQVELEIRSAPSGDRVAMEERIVREVGEAMVPAFNAMHERLEELSGRIDPESRMVHQSFSKRQLHPLVLCSPFAYRAYQKPLGYAGDYEMVNMIAREPYEGGSLFAKVVNLWFLRQWPVQAHRNRIKYLKDTLLKESLRGVRRGKPIQVLNLGCGPAREVQEFLTEDNSCEFTQLTLLDFNTETIDHTTRVLADIKRTAGRQTQIQVKKKSVQQVLKEGSKAALGTDNRNYDFIYCAGLFDYLSDPVCRQLTSVFYDWLAPGGLVVATNVSDCKPFRHMLEFVLDWHLVYRDAKQVEALAPKRAASNWVHTQQDMTGVNVLVEIRKPDHG